MVRARSTPSLVNSAISSISTQAPIGICATPKALRACAPTSGPKTSPSSSEQPLVTRCCSVKVGRAVHQAHHLDDALTRAPGRRPRRSMCPADRWRSRAPRPCLRRCSSSVRAGRPRACRRACAMWPETKTSVAAAHERHIGGGRHRQRRQRDAQGIEAVVDGWHGWWRGVEMEADILHCAHGSAAGHRRRAGRGWRWPGWLGIGAAAAAAGAVADRGLCGAGWPRRRSGVLRAGAGAGRPRFAGAWAALLALRARLAGTGARSVPAGRRLPAALEGVDLSSPASSPACRRLVAQGTALRLRRRAGHARWRSR